jgi:hypothetical protein
MNSNQRWFGWIGIGLGALALLVALAGRGFGSQSTAGFGGANMQQAYAQQGAGPQNDAVAPGANVQPGVGQQSTGQSGPAGLGGNAQPGRGRTGNGPQNGSAAPRADTRRGPGQPGQGGFGLGSWFNFPFKLFGGIFQLGMLALLIVLGVWLLRGRGNAAASGLTVPAQAPSQEPLSPTGESYTDEPSDHE